MPTDIKWTCSHCDHEMRFEGEAIEAGPVFLKLANLECPQCHQVGALIAFAASEGPPSDEARDA